MTSAQNEVVKTISENGGFACYSEGWPSGWFCAKLDEKMSAFVICGPALPKRVMSALSQAGKLERAGPGYSQKSFWKVKGDANGT